MCMDMVFMCDDASKYENPSPYSDEGIAKSQRIHFFWWLIGVLFWMWLINYIIIPLASFITNLIFT